QHSVPSATPHHDAPASRSLRSPRYPPQRTPATGPSRVTIHRRLRPAGRGAYQREEASVTSGGARRGRRDNGLVAAVYAVAGDVGDLAGGRGPRRGGPGHRGPGHRRPGRIGPDAATRDAADREAGAGPDAAQPGRLKRWRSSTVDPRDSVGRGFDGYADEDED